METAEVLGLYKSYDDALVATDALLLDTSYVAKTIRFAIAADDLLLQLKSWRATWDAATDQQQSAVGRPVPRDSEHIESLTACLASIAESLRELSLTIEPRSTSEIEAALWHAHNQAIELADVTTTMRSKRQNEQWPYDTSERHKHKLLGQQHNRNVREESIVGAEGNKGGPIWVQIYDLPTSDEVFGRILEAAEDRVDISSFQREVTSEGLGPYWLRVTAGGQSESQELLVRLVTFAENHSQDFADDPAALVGAARRFIENPASLSRSGASNYASAAEQANHDGGTRNESCTNPGVSNLVRP